MKFSYIPFLEDSDKVIAGFTLKNTTYSAVAAKINGLNIGLNQLEEQKIVIENREKFFNSIGIELSEVTSASQIHSNIVFMVNEAGKIVSDVDALVTKERGICLLIQVADCAPIILCDEKNEVISVVHAGWRGAATGILTNAISEMAKLGANLKSLKMMIGPCIGFNNFEVGPEVAAVFPKAFSRKKANGKFLLNLKAFLKDQALELGLDEANIIVSDRCSVEDQENCYSHRREGNNAGRMGGFIYIKP